MFCVIFVLSFFVFDDEILACVVVTSEGGLDTWSGTRGFRIHEQYCERNLLTKRLTKYKVKNGMFNRTSHKRVSDSITKL